MGRQGAGCRHRVIGQASPVQSLGFRLCLELCSRVSGPCLCLSLRPPRPPPQVPSGHSLGPHPQAPSAFLRHPPPRPLSLPRPPRLSQAPSGHLMPHLRPPYAPPQAPSGHSLTLPQATSCPPPDPRRGPLRPAVVQCSRELWFGWSRWSGRGPCLSRFLFIKGTLVCSVHRCCFLLRGL